MLPVGKRILLAALACFAIVSAIPVVHAGELVWRFRSEHPKRVQLEFYSASGDHVWPGGNEVYAIADGKVHTYTLSCRSGEKICYGAWLKSNTRSYWGSGYDGRQSCDSCCFTCDAGDTPVIVLNR